jgi:hypothetical protein
MGQIVGARWAHYDIRSRDIHCLHVQLLAQRCRSGAGDRKKLTIGLKTHAVARHLQRFVSP